MTTPTLLADPEPIPLVFPPGSYAARVVADGASNFWRLGESAGTTAVDIVGGANGTLSGGVTLGQPGGVPGDTAMLFNGSTGKASTAATVTIPVAATIEAWVKYVADGTIQPVLALGSVERPVLAVQTNGVVQFYDGLPNIAFNGPVLPAGSWQHVVVVLTGTTATFYQNGAQATTGAYARPALSADLAHLGADPAFGAAPNGFFNGALDEVAIYPRALAPSEVAAHYAAGTTLGPGDTTTLWRKWQDSNQAFNNEEHAALLNGFPPQDLTTQLSRFLWGSYASSQNPTAAHDRYVNMVLADGASHFWRLSDSGTTAVDIAGGVSGTLSGGVTTGVAGAFSGDTAMTLNGTTGYVDMGNVADLAITGAFSVEVWVKFAVDHAPYFIGKTDAATGQGWALARNLSSGTLRFYAYTGASVAVFDFNSTVSHTDSLWHHVVAVWDGTTGASGARIYIDGIQEGAATANAGTPAVTARRFLLGAIDTGAGQSNYLNGSLDDVAVYPRALSAAEVARHYAARG